MLKSEIESNENFSPLIQAGQHGPTGGQGGKGCDTTPTERVGEGGGNKEEILQLSQMKSWSGETNRLGKIAWKKVNPSKVGKK